MSQTLAQAEPVAAATASGASLLDDIVHRSRVARSDTEHARARDLIAELVREVMQGTVVVSDNLGATLDARIAQIDALISEQLSEVMHHEQFQRLESTWTGLHYLCKQTSTGPLLKIKVFNATRRELVKDFKSAIDFDQSALFKKVYEEEFGTFGGAPFGALVGDYTITRHPEDMYFVEQMSHVAAAAHAPFLSAASQRAVRAGEPSPTWARPRDLAKVFDTVDYAKWKHVPGGRGFARYVGLTRAALPGPAAVTTRKRRPSRPKASTSSRNVDGSGPFSKLPVGERGVRPGRAADTLRSRTYRLVRGHPRRGGRRPGGRPAHPHLQDR
jgi:type VI secretion system protein ImpC